MNPIPRIALIAAALATPANAIEFLPYKQYGKDYIIMSGSIQPGDDEKFIKFAQGYRDGSVLQLDSLGGRLNEALNIGRFVRAHKWGTVVYHGAICVSGCALIWVAGVPRQLGIPGYSAMVGLHSASTADGKRSADANARIDAYLREMDAPKEFIDLWPKADPCCVNNVGPSKAQEWGLE
jgi:hypothetical protein